jgi:two-component system, NtrC family, response regulator AlgB
MNPELQAPRQTSFSVVLLDPKLGQENALKVLDEIHRLAPSAAVVMITAFSAHASIETAAEAIRQGSFDYPPEPYPLEQTRQVLDRILRTQRLERRVLELESQLQSQAPELELTSDVPAMQKTLEVARRAAASEATVLLSGESGTGKSALARAVHEHSGRRERAFVTVNCPNVSRECLETELFGHVKGPLTGAHQDRTGKVAAAQGGTLLLDDIGELPFEIQAKLLRLLQKGEYERVGDPRCQKADLRVIATTDRDLAQAVAEGRFREDLYDQLNVIRISLPPLRERAADIPRLAGNHLRSFARQAGKRFDGFSKEALAKMQGYAWPGNLAELRNVVERAVLVGSGAVIQADHLAIWPGGEKRPQARLGARVSLATIENEHIRQVLAQSRTVDEAAEVLGIDPATLYRRKKRL